MAQLSRFRFTSRWVKGFLHPPVPPLRDSPLVDRRPPAILHHTNWIAFKNGEHVEFCSRNYPGYSIRMPEMAREITNCWICSVPSKMS